MTKILCVGAHPAYQGFLYGLFRRTGGYEDTYVREIAEAKALIKTQRPDLILYETNPKREETDNGVLELLNLTDHNIPVVITSTCRDPAFEQQTLENGALWYLRRPFNAEVFQKYINDAVKVQRDIKRIIRSVEFRPDHHHAGVGILSYFSRILERKYPNEHYTVVIRQEGSNVTLEVETSDGTVDKIETALTDYGLVVSGARTPDSLLDDKFEVMALRNKLDIAALEIRQNQQLYSLAAERHKQDVDRLDAEIEYLRQLVGAVMTERRDSQREFLDLINRLTKVTGEQATSALGLLEERFERGYRPSDEQDVKDALACVEKEQPGFLRKLNDIILKGSISGASGNYLYSWLVALTSSLPK